MYADVYCSFSYMYIVAFDIFANYIFFKTRLGLTVFRYLGYTTIFCIDGLCVCVGMGGWGGGIFL